MNESDKKSGWRNFREGLQSKWHRFFEGNTKDSSSGINNWSAKTPANPNPELPKNNNPNVPGQLESDIQSDFSSKDEGLY